MSDTLKDRLRQLANTDFPAAARSGDYPVRFNHCFLRIVYDNLFGGKWQEALSNGKPAIHQLTEEQLTAAIELGERLIDDPAHCRLLNERSLRWRGKWKE